MNLTTPKIDLTPLEHVLVTLILQLIVGLSTGLWWVGGAIGSTFFIGREHTQAEYRWIEKFGQGKRANMPWWGGFDVRIWDFGSLLDWLCPVVASVLLAISLAWIQHSWL